MDSMQIGTMSMEAVSDGSSPTGGNTRESPSATDLPVVTHPPPQSPPISSTGTAYASSSSKRKNPEEETAEREENGGAPLHTPLWKTSLCSFFRRRSLSCSHGDKCRYAHGEEELRPRPDNSWDPTSERAKKLLKGEGAGVKILGRKEEAEDATLWEDVCPPTSDTLDESSSEAGLSAFKKCLVHLPRKWTSENLTNFLDSEGILYESARKKKGMTVGFACFSSLEQVLHAAEKLDGKPMGNKHVKVADVILQSCDVQPAKIRRVRDVVTPLAHMSYDDQLDHKKNSLTQMLKKLTRSARKACPDAAELPDWILKSRDIGGLPCKLEGIIRSPLTKGYRNKCEFSLGYSLMGELTVGFMLGNFREGIIAVEEPVDCPNVSDIARKYASFFQDFLRSSSLPVWNRIQNSGFWRQFTVREGRSPSDGPTCSETKDASIAEVMLIVQVCSLGIDEELKNREFHRMAEVLSFGAATSAPPLPLTSLVMQDHTGISNAAPVDSPTFALAIPKKGNIYGFTEPNASEARIHDYINGLRFSISPTAFFQVNTLAAEKLYSLAGDWARLGPDTLLFDICCGTGTIGLTLAHRVGMVVGIEMNSSAVSDAWRNATINGVKNCHFVCAKAEDVVGSLLKEYVMLPEQHDASTRISGSNGQGTDANGVTVDFVGRSSPILETEPESSIDTKRVGHVHNPMHHVDDVVATENQLIRNSYLSTDRENCTHDSESTEPSSHNCASEEVLNFTYEGASSDTGLPLSKNDKLDHAEPLQGNNKLNVLQFKDVVAIVDPPRVGLHPSVIKALRTHPSLRRLVYISCNPESLVANAIELCTPAINKPEKGKNRGCWRNMSSAGLARQRVKSMPVSEPFQPVKAMAIDLFPHTPHCEMVMLFER
ncbi:Zinc finger CCCH domain-containing protein 24 [Nymphaea thermarum]|nr:Zinc finger CCCH domain-containing protein 24 [Nymphaea thermarum]